MLLAYDSKAQRYVEVAISTREGSGGCEVASWLEITHIKVNADCVNLFILRHDIIVSHSKQQLYTSL